jgi:hypothetical protein
MMKNDSHPKGLDPQAIDALDDIVSSWLSWRNEDHFAQIQQQLNNTPENWFSAATRCKCGIIIDLQGVEHAQIEKASSE